MNNPFTLYAHGIAHRFHLRLAEWSLAVFMVLCSAVLFLPESTFALEPYSILRAIADESSWAVVLLSLGVLRLIVLAINGSLPRGSPHIRAVLAAIAAAIWAVLFAGYLASAFPSLMLAATLSAIVTEFVVISRAAGSARVEDAERGRNGTHPG